MTGFEPSKREQLRRTCVGACGLGPHLPLPQEVKTRTRKVAPLKVSLNIHIYIYM